MSKQLYQDVLDAIPAVTAAMSILENATEQTPNAVEISPELNSISEDLNGIQQWAQENYDREEQQELLNTFLNELKTLFTTYSAVIDVVEVEAGYGVSYGSSTLAMQVSVGQNGVQASKTYATISLDSQDLP